MHHSGSNRSAKFQLVARLGVGQDRGFSLIELLVALLIISVSLVGMTRLQTLNLQQHRSALLQDHARLMLTDMLARISVNPSVNYARLSLSDRPGSARPCIAQRCSPEEMRDFDITEWRCRINAMTRSGTPYPACTQLGVTGLLPGLPCRSAEDICSGGAITRADDVYTVSVQWVEHRGLPRNRQLSMQMLLDPP